MPSAPSRIVRLTCPGTPATADILADRGAACGAATLVHNGSAHQVVWSPPGYGTPAVAGFMGGIPILCPFVGRLHTGRCEFRGRRFTVPTPPGARLPIHGFVHDRPWRVIDRATNRITLEFQLSRDAADLRDAWPADFRLTATWSLAVASLSLDLSLEPLASMPAAVGVHPYFPLPVVPGGDPRACLIDLPARSWQPLVHGRATGSPVPASQRLAFPGAVAVGDTELDDVFVDLVATDGRVRTKLVDPAGRAIGLRFDPVFTTCVVYTPPDRRSLCIEPWTAVPDAPPFREASGWRTLEAGEPFGAGMTITVE